MIIGSLRGGNQIDLRTAAGIRSVTVTPGNSVQYVANAQQSRIGASGGQKGLYNYVRLACIEGNMTVVRSSGGTTPIFADQFPRCIKSIGLQVPLIGTMIDPAITDGMVAKHIMEYFGMGYQTQGVNRQPIPGSDGTYTRTFELCLPFFQGNNPWPDHFDHWLGWLDQGIYEIFVQDASNPFGVSAGVTITNVQFNMWFETIPYSEIIIPPLSVVRRYTQAASAGSTGPILTGVGAPGSIQGVDDSSRLQAMLFSHAAGGFNGSGTADQITAITMPWRDQAQSTEPQGFFQRFLTSAKSSQLGYDPAVNNVFDNTPPYPMVSNPGTGHLNDASARYTPLVWDTRGGLISQMQKVRGNYPLDGMTFGSSQSASFIVYTRELKQYSLDKCSELLAAMGVDPSKVALVPKLGRKNVKPVDPSKFFGFPRTVVAKTA